MTRPLLTYRVGGGEEEWERGLLSLVCFPTTVSPNSTAPTIRSDSEFIRGLRSE